MFIKDIPKPKVRTALEIESYIDNRLKQHWSDEKKALLDEILEEIDRVNKNN
jgi:hypothetical protein